MSSRFSALTPDFLLSAVERLGLEPTGHVTALTCLENRVFDLRLEEGRHVVVKFYRPGRWSREAILEEHRFLLELREEAEIPVCAPLRFEAGQTLFEMDGIFYAVWPRVGGRSPDELGAEELPVLGRLLARIHNTGAVRDAPHRPELTGEHYGLAPLSFLVEHRFLPPSVESRYRRAAEAVVEIYEARREGVPFHRIHGDCHLGNLLKGYEGFFFLDFDDFLRGPAVQDVWMLLPGREPEDRGRRQRLIAAYREFRDFDERWLALVEPLRSLRFIRYAGWIASRRDDPAFPAAYPHFGTPEYWEKETRDLEEQVARMRAGEDLEPVREVGPAEAQEAQELTRRDYFFDL